MVHDSTCHPLEKQILSALFVAFSVLGASIKIQGSIALDAFPAFLGAILLGPGFGFIIAVVGHLFSAFFSGFPLTVVLHLCTGVLMGLVVYGYGLLRHYTNRFWPMVYAVVSNGPVSLGIIALIAKGLGFPLQGMAMVSLLLLPLSMASFLNVVLAESIAVALKKVYGRRRFR
ncbi:MAG TPA: ECF transporter S component [Clostridiaceae bacterium]|nr:ECF transporter S component [Clostridiaceae bacterium]